MIFYRRLSVQSDEEFAVVQCRDCDFVFSSDVPSDQFLTALYEPGDLQDAIKLFARPERASYAYDSLARLLSAIALRCESTTAAVSKHSIRILDVGCAFWSWIFRSLPVRIPLPSYWS